MMRSVILVIDIRFWSSEDFTTPTPTTAVSCGLLACSGGCEHRGSTYIGSYDIWVFL